MRLNWSRWQPIHQPAEHNTPAVYIVRIVYAKRPVRIPRFLASDRRGILTIGKTSKMETRRRQFIRGLDGNWGHSEAELLHMIRRAASLPRSIAKGALEYTQAPIPEHIDLDRIEEVLMKTYAREYGEPPPLNSAIPNRYSSWDYSEEIESLGPA
jgi:hypothetical protein